MKPIAEDRAPPPPASSLRSPWLLVALLALLLAALAFFSPVSNAASDPHFSLIVSQSLLEQGTLALDAYKESHPHLFEAYFWQVVTLNGHPYYNYPLAPSLVALPAVGLARLAGLDMLVIAHNHFLQQVLAALACALIFVLVFVLARTYVDDAAALVIALVSTLGSALVSTVATAYWNMDVSVVLILSALILLARLDRGKSQDAHPYLLGFLLFAAYFTRPSAAIFILVVFIFLLFRERGALLRTAATSFALLVLFVVHSRLTYGLWLPIYYTASQWFNPVGFWRPLYGVTFSPSRGLFIYSPFFLLVFVAGVVYVRRLGSRLLFFLCAFWLVMQLATVAMTRQWHGGFSYGPRLLTDAIPALILITAIVWRALCAGLAPRRRRWALAAYLALGLFGVFINSVQGIFNIKTAMWNAFPNVDEHPQLLFDWRYPQFLTTLNSFHERRLRFFLGQIAGGELELAPYEWGQALRPTLETTGAVWHGWWPSTSGEWWSETAQTSVILAPDAALRPDEIVLEISAIAPERRDVVVSVNGLRVGRVHFGPQAQRARLVFDGDLIAGHNTLRLMLSLPELSGLPRWKATSSVLSYNPHRLGIGNAEIRLFPAQSN